MPGLSNSSGSQLNLRISKYKTLLVLVMLNSQYDSKGLHMLMMLSPVMNRSCPWLNLSDEVAEDCTSHIRVRKIVLTGAKVRDETYAAFEIIYPALTEFRKPNNDLTQ